MNVTFYSFAKRRNSTKLPVSGGVELNCQLKETTNLVNPVLSIKQTPTGAAPQWTYCYIPLFTRYYFIEEWTWINAVWVATCLCDVLGSFKTQIGTLSEYVLRSSHEFDSDVVDTIYPVTTEVTTSQNMVDEFYVRVMSAGFYIVGVIGQDSTATQGAITYYQMSAEQMARLRSYLLSDTFLSDQGLQQLTDFIPADATKVIYNPYQYIVSCQWFPFQMSAIPDAFKDSVNQIYFGWWNTGAGFSAYRLKAAAPVYSNTCDITVPAHPQISRGDYLNHSPYTTRILRMAPFGELKIPDQFFDNGDKLRIELQVDFITGVGVLILYALTSANVNKMMLARESQKIGVDIQLAQVGTDYYGAMSQYTADMGTELAMGGSIAGSVVQGVTSGMAKNYAGMAVDAAKAGANVYQVQAFDKYTTIGNYTKNMAPQVITGGHNGSMADYTQNNYLCNTFYHVVGDDNARNGKPLCATRRISNIPGFIMVQNPDVEISCTYGEKSAIEQFMQAGFFYE